jgi:hypothetical protein
LLIGEGSKSDIQLGFSAEAQDEELLAKLGNPSEAGHILEADIVIDFGRLNCITLE